MRNLWKTISTISKYPKISLREERRLIAKAKKGSQKELEELVLRHLNFILYRIHKKAFPSYIDRFGEDIFSEAVFILYEKIATYNLRYRDRKGDFKPVRFSSYIWKRIDGFILDSLKKGLRGKGGTHALIGKDMIIKRRLRMIFGKCPGIAVWTSISYYMPISCAILASKIPDKKDIFYA